MFQLFDPTSGAPKPATGGGIVLSPDAESGVITPSDAVVYDPPITVWVGDPGPVDVNIIPYGRDGDHQVTFPVMAGMTIPVLCKQVLATGTTAVSLIRGSAWPGYAASGSSGPVTADSTAVTADTTSFTADNG